MSGRGHRTVELLKQLRAARTKVEKQGPLAEGADNARLLSALDSMIEQGEEFEGFWRDAVHGDAPSRAEVRETKHEWRAWAGVGLDATRDLSGPSDS